MNSLFADSHYDIALANASDADHAKAVAIARIVSRPIVTTAWKAKSPSAACAQTPSTANALNRPASGFPCFSIQGTP